MRLVAMLLAVLVAAALWSSAAAQSTPAPSPAPRDSFQCYETHRPKLDLPNVSLTDELGASTVTIRRAKRLCAPVNVDGTDPTAPSHPAHLTAYTIKQTSPRFTRVRDRPVTTRFGTFVVDLVRPDRLLVPTAKSLSGPPAALAQPIDHYKCYRVQGARFHAEGVSMQDQFGSSTVDVLKPLHFCPPVEKNGEGMLDPENALLCFQARGPRPPIPGGVFTVDQLGNDAFDPFGPREECFSAPELPKVFVEVNDAGKDVGVPSCVEEWRDENCRGTIVTRHGDICVTAADPDLPVAQAPMIREAFAKSRTQPVCPMNTCCERMLRDPPFACKEWCDEIFGKNQCTFTMCETMNPIAAGCENVISAQCKCEGCD